MFIVLVENECFWDVWFATAAIELGKELAFGLKIISKITVVVEVFVFGNIGQDSNIKVNSPESVLVQGVG